MEIFTDLQHYINSFKSKVSFSNSEELGGHLLNGGRYKKNKWKLIVLINGVARSLAQYCVVIVVINAMSLYSLV